MVSRLIALLAVVLISSSCNMAPKDYGPLRTVTIAAPLHSFINLPVYVAIMKGFFAEEGIQIQWIPTSSDTDTINKLLSKKALIGLANPSAVAADKETSSKCIAIGAYINKVPFWAVTYTPSEVVTSRASLAGRRIAVEYPPAFSYALGQDMALYSGANFKASLVPSMNIEGVIASIKSNKAQIAICEEPTVSILADEKKARVCGSFAKEFGDFAYRGVIVNKAAMKAGSIEIQAVINALSKAVVFINSDKAGTVQNLRMEFPELGEMVIGDAVKRLLDIQAIPTDLSISNFAWEKSYGFRREIGELHSDAPFAANVDMSFVEKAPKLQVIPVKQ